MKALVCLTILLFSNLLWAHDLTPLDPQQIESLLLDFEYSPLQNPLSESQPSSAGNCWKYTVEVEVRGKLLKPEIKKFVVLTPQLNKHLPVVLLVPTILGVTIESQVAQKFCAIGIASVLATVNENIEPEVFPGWGFENQSIISSILSLRTLVDYISISPHFDASRIGVWGASLGGITTAMFAAIEKDRLSAVVMVVAGGNFPEILSNSQEGHVLSLREKRMKAAGQTSIAEYEEKLHQTIQYDPLYFASKAKTEKILMIISNRDYAVPSKNQWDLHQALGSPQTLVYSLSHAQSVGYAATFDFSKIKQFFKEKMNIP